MHSTTSDEPPRLTKGSAMPFVGTLAVTTATFPAAWRPIQNTRPKVRRNPKRSRRAAPSATRRPQRISAA